jgi:hypothetical protein
MNLSYFNILNLLHYITFSYKTSPILRTLIYYILLRLVTKRLLL